MMGGKSTDDKQQTAPCVPKSKHLPQHHPDLFWSDNAKSSPAENNPETKNKGRHQLKKNVFFRALPELPKPPPHDPNSGNLVLFFRKSKFKIWKSV